MAELAHDHDQRLLQQDALGEVFEERRNGSIGVW